MKTDRRGRLRYTPEQKNTMVDAYLANGLQIDQSASPRAVTSAATGEEQCTWPRL